MNSIEIQKIMLDKGINKKTLAEKCGWSASNFGNKLKRDSWSQEDLKKIADALDMTLQISFVDNDGENK